MRIEKIEILPVTVPVIAPLLTCYGSLSAYARNIVKLTTDNGLVGWGETSGRYGARIFDRFGHIIRGMNPFDTTLICARIKNWSYYPYDKPEPLMAAFEMACLDIQGKALDEPVHRLLGGQMRDKVPVSAYLFYRHANADGKGEIHSVEQMIAHARERVAEAGFGTLKLKGGYFPPETDRDVLEALRETFGRDMRLRLDPQGCWSPATAVRIGRDIDKLGLEYYEDPCWNAAGMATVRRAVRTPLATNMCITQFEDLYPAVQAGAVDIILAGLGYWGGMRASLALDRTCGALGLDVGMFAHAELGVAWAAMVHLAAAMPNLKLAIDDMNQHLRDDVLVGTPLAVTDGHVAVPQGPGLGIKIDETKLSQFCALAQSGVLDDRLIDPTKADSARPGWFPEMPAW